MELIGAITQIGTFILAIVGAWLAIATLRSSSHEARAARAAEMSWQVYQSYIEPRIRSARGAARQIAYTPPVPSSGAEYGERYADRTNTMEETENVGVSMRRLLRFYNQVGILMDKQLLDEDFIFGLIGSGLKDGWPAVRVAIDWYQNYYAGATGFEKAPVPRPIYRHVPEMYERYLRWEATQSRPRR